MSGINCVSIRYTSSHTHTQTGCLFTLAVCVCVCNYVPAQTRSVCQCFRQAGSGQAENQLHSASHRAYAALSIVTLFYCLLLLLFFLLLTRFLFSFVAFPILSPNPNHEHRHRRALDIGYWPSHRQLTLPLPPSLPLLCSVFPLWRRCK